MKTKALLIGLTILVIASCVKNKVATPEAPNVEEDELNIPLNFDWKTTKAQPITIAEYSDILSSEGDTIASNLAPGTYNLSIPIGTTYITKAVSSKTKSAETLPSKVYFPTDGKKATMIFEDTFPYHGDMDMNDVFLAFNYEYELAYENNTAYVKVFKVNAVGRACGSAYKDIAIGLKLGIDPNTYSVWKITGYNCPSSDNLFQINNSNVRTEPDIEGAIVVPIVNNYRVFFNPEIDGMANVHAKIAGVRGATKVINVYFNQPYPTLDQLEYETGNAQLFAIFNKRENEVFIKGGKPTSKFNIDHFKNLKREDFSDAADNMVWGFMVPKEFENGFLPPLETIPMYEAYPDFETWIESNGASAQDWYLRPNMEKVFKKFY